MGLWAFRPWPAVIPLRGYRVELRDRPTKVRRADLNDPLCARPGCRVESWDWHRCVMRGPFAPWRLPRLNGRPRRDLQG